MINELFYILFFFFQVFKTWHVFYSWSASQFRLLTFQVLRSHMLAQIGPSRSLSSCSLSPAWFSIRIVCVSVGHILRILLSLSFWARCGRGCGRGWRTSPLRRSLRKKPNTEPFSFYPALLPGFPAAREWSPCFALGLGGFHLWFIYGRIRWHRCFLRK